MNFTSIPIVATAISVVICWALFAILCSLVHEAMAQVLAERGRFMKRYLIQQLQDIPNGVNWATLLYNHGAIDLLSRAHNKPTSNIDPQLFAQTIIDVVGKSHVVQTQLPILAEAQNAGNPDAAVPFNHIALHDFKAATLLLKPSDVNTMLKQAMQSAELRAIGRDEAKVYEELVKYLENWFVQFTERLNLWYQKKTRLYLFIIGMIMGIILNVDSLQLFQYFNKNPAAREAVIQYYQQNGSQLSNMADQLANNNIDDSTRQNLKEIIKQTKDYTHQMDSLAKENGIPVGPSKFSLARGEFPAGGFGTFLSYLFKVMGLLITGFAASYGAPFWFNLLKKVYTRK